ncbi:hypothetical protein CY652_10685 [Burkholderia sp. WAC0059]|uniref:hypothetical protein n=1 Tax=Burkholderia sp. WAC0059 TaxID=2066022 RepID=UPI000C7EA2B5|nr:hypothetical protein [Burkholderia sp. WAC0059]PLZ02567.1 hypothetical protein CY652_10685 [Burkholderia sp. WAC0059]
MAEGISIREFARRECVSDTPVRRALKQARVKAFDDGTLDPSLIGTAWREGNAKGAAPAVSSSANKGCEHECEQGEQFAGFAWCLHWCWHPTAAE